MDIRNAPLLEHVASEVSHHIGQVTPETSVTTQLGDRRSHMHRHTAQHSLSGDSLYEKDHGHVACASS